MLKLLEVINITNLLLFQVMAEKGDVKEKGGKKEKKVAAPVSQYPTEVCVHACVIWYSPTE